MNCERGNDECLHMVSVCHYYSSYIASLSQAEPEYYEGDQRLPIFCRVRANRQRLLSTEDTIACVLKPKLNPMFICRKVPTAIHHNVCFVVDTSALQDSHDLLSDDMGVWRNNWVERIKVSVRKGKKQRCQTH